MDDATVKDLEAAKTQIGRLDIPALKNALQPLIDTFNLWSSRLEEYIGEEDDGDAATAMEEAKNKIDDALAHASYFTEVFERSVIEDSLDEAILCEDNDDGEEEEEEEEEETED